MASFDFHHHCSSLRGLVLVLASCNMSIICEHVHILELWKSFKFWVAVAMLQMCRKPLKFGLMSAVYLAEAPQQTCAIHLILFQCWPNVFSAGPLSVMLCQHYSDLIPLSSDHGYNRDIIFFFTLFKYTII